MQKSNQINEENNIRFGKKVLFMKRLFSIFFLFSLFLSGCSLIPARKAESTTIPPTEVPSATPLPNPVAQITEVPPAEDTAKSFLEAWKKESYVDMYNLLTSGSRDAITYDDFLKRYTDTSTTMTLKDLNYEITSTLTDPAHSQIGYHVTFSTNAVGDFSRDMEMNLVLDAGSWKIQWEDGMIMPELRGGNKLAMDITLPTRGTIYDKNGIPLAAESEAYSIGVIPAQISSNRWGALVNELSRLTGKTTYVIQQMLKVENQNDYVIIGEVPADVLDERYNIISNYAGVALNKYSASRFYYDGGVAPHVVGYVQPIGEDEAPTLQREGFRIDERVGRLGIEKWGQDQLTGTRGYSLYVTDAAGNAISRLVKTDALAANTIYTTFDSNFQYDLQRSIAGLKGAVVVMEMNTGRVLGMASAPTFDPNLLDFNNYNSYYSGDVLYGDNRPMYNRATQGQYPPGSIFKIISMAAALESGVYKIDDTLYCGHFFTELDGVKLSDWTYDDDLPESGTLTLAEGLMRSCNPWFYKVGLELFRQAGADYLPNMAKAFGLGSKTGIEQIEEEPGNIDTPADEYSSVQMGIGQSTILITPLQAARYAAAVGNGGTLYRPQVVEQIVDPKGNTVQSFSPEAQGTLPVSQEHLKMIQDAMLTVTQNSRGTAYHVFKFLKYEVHGKTGTAQTGPSTKPDAWFIGYSQVNKKDKPDIAIAVLCENQGEGADWAAPIFRRVMELYFDGKASLLYNWEAGVYITKTPTLTPTITPTTAPTKSPWEKTQLAISATETPQEQ